jgi:hypothetical protein
MKRTLLLGVAVGLGMILWHQFPEIRRYVRIELM